MELTGTVDIGDLARVFLLKLREERWSLVECVGSGDPALPRSSKMVLVISTQFGCAMGCRICDASSEYHGNLSAEEIHSQIDFLLERWAGSDAQECAKLKVQFARMGEPSMNPAVLKVLEDLPSRHSIPGLIPCIATVAPSACGAWFEGLLEVKDSLYDRGFFQLQFSIQSTDEPRRREMIPADSWGLEQIAAYTERFVRPGDRKATLNFALARDCDLDPGVLGSVFCSAKCLIKITPLNPTAAASRSGLGSAFDGNRDAAVFDLAHEIASRGFEVIVSRGLDIESRLGSSCGQLAFARARSLDRTMAEG
jgi:23S rRNA (adenine2503-C2)-methyltransferase